MVTHRFAERLVSEKVCGSNGGFSTADGGQARN